MKKAYLINVKTVARLEVYRSQRQWSHLSMKYILIMFLLKLKPMTGTGGFKGGQGGPWPKAPRL